MGDWYCNLPGVIMTTHKITDGIVNVSDTAKTVEMEVWTNTFTMQFYREDAEVLRYIADALESFDQARPEDKDEDIDMEVLKQTLPDRIKQAQRQAGGIAAGDDPLTSALGDPRKVNGKVINGATPELQAFALR